MNRATYGVAAVVLAAAGVADADHLPGTMNFTNQTAGRIAWTVAESTSNEKEVEFGDFDNDNDLFFLIAVASGDFFLRKNKMYRNDVGIFNEISATVPLFTANAGDVARTAFFRDYTMDGWLDLIIVCDHNTAGNPGRTKMWVNQHIGGIHTGWTEEGIARLGASTGGAACSAVSINHDQVSGFDLYVGNYPGPSQDTAYFNNGSGVFTAMTGLNVPPDGDYTVDVAAGDLNGDGKTDLLISNEFNPNYVYYNHLLDQGSGVGDYSYGAGGYGGRQSLGTASGENAMEPGDFDGDGDLDIYWTNRSGGTGDVILVNQGNLASGMANWTTFTDLPDSVTSRISRKATVVDLNDDKRVDILVMKQDFTNSRPTILRNTSVNGQISFVDWTPAPAFPTGNLHRGWHAAVFDTGGDGDLDIFLGAFAGDHLFEQFSSNEIDEDDGQLGNALPPLWNVSPVALVGHATDGEVDLYSAPNILTASIMSVIVNGPDDYAIEVRDATKTLLGSSNRGGVGVEEALQVDVPPGTLSISVTVIESVASSPADINNDSAVNVLDLIDLLLCFGQPAVPGCDAEDVNGDGTVNVVDLIDVLLEFGTVLSNDYILEVLVRSG